MTAEFAGERRRRRIIILVALVLAVLAAIGTYALATRPGGAGPAATPQLVRIVVAAVPIQARTQIEEAMLTTRTVPDSPEALQFVVTDIEQAVGQVTVINIAQGQPLQTNFFGSATAGGLNILAPGETIAPDSPNWRAVSISVPRERAVGGLITPGDHIDLFATIEIQVFDENGEEAQAPLPDGFYSGDSTKVTLTDLEVLSADPDTDMYILKVDENQAEEIAHIQVSGENSFTISLRPNTDTRALDANLFGETTNRILEQYGFPVPQAIQLPGTVPGPTASPVPTESPGP